MCFHAGWFVPRNNRLACIGACTLQGLPASSIETGSAIAKDLCVVTGDSDQTTEAPSYGAGPSGKCRPGLARPCAASTA
jgi:hypothetical protein